MLSVQFQRGLWLPRLGLWLDPPEPRSGPDRVFVSHAHSDHIAAHEEVILTAGTAALWRTRLSPAATEHVLEFGQPRAFQTGSIRWQMTLWPAGHILGSAMALVEAEGESLLYTGDFKLRPSRTAGCCQPPHADVLVMETTYGQSRYTFPPTEAVWAGVIRFCREALDNDEIPVLLGYPLGKCQEVLASLAGTSLPVMLHESVLQLTRVYEQFGCRFPPYQPLDVQRARGHVVLGPPALAHLPTLRAAGRVRAAVLTGWAMDENCRFRYGAEAAFPVSDHADFEDLIELVRQVTPRKVFTVHGFAAEFAATLRQMGFDAQALSEPEQMDLGLGLNAAAAPKLRPEPPLSLQPPSIPTEGAELFVGFAQACAAIAATQSKLQKVSVLAAYLRQLKRPGIVAPWFAGTPFPLSQNKTLQLGWASLRDACCAVAQINRTEFAQVYLKHSDLGETIFELGQRHLASQPTLTLSGVQELLEALHAARGPTAKRPLLIQALRHCTALEAKFLLKIMTGDLRIGLKEGLVEEAIAQAFGAPAEHVRLANLLLGDIAQTAELAQKNALASATLAPFRPVKWMLASAESTAAAVWARMQQRLVAGLASDLPDSGHSAAGRGSGPLDLQAMRPPDSPGCSEQPRAAAVWVEDKYDGIRCQVHKVGGRVAIYSRDLKEVTATFPEIVRAAGRLEADVILDGEIVAMRGDQVLPFAELQRRLGRQEADLFLGTEIPVTYVVFDLLWLNGQSLLEAPLAQRRARLEALTPWPEVFRLAQVTWAHSAEEIEAAFAAARQRGNEGLMIKDPQSRYTPGRRGLAWLKLKKAFATLDCVVVGVEYGHGRRKNVLSDYTFAVRDPDTGQLKTIGKAYSGLTDAEIAALTRHFLERVVRRQGRYMEVEPDVVLEIAFDSIQPSPRHSSGLALRFPRIVRIRTDKTVADIDTVATARRLMSTSALRRAGKCSGAGPVER